MTMTALRGIVIALMTTLVFASPIVSAESAVELDSIIYLSENDLSIKGIAENPQGNKILIYGEGGYANIISSKNPDSQEIGRASCRERV